MAKRMCRVNYYRWTEGSGKPKRISRASAEATWGTRIVNNLRSMACRTGQAHGGGGKGPSGVGLVVRKPGREEWLR